MPGLMKASLAVYWLALTLWIGALFAAGVAAVSSFRHLPAPELGLRLERFAAYDEARHGHIAAGKVMEPIFTFVDLVQVAAGALVIVTLILQLTMFQQPWRRAANLVRTICIVLVTILFLFRAGTITPQMNKDLRAYWAAAEAGELEQAAAYRERFDAAHRRARPMFDASLVLLLVAAGASAMALSPPLEQRRTSALPEPELLRRSR